MTVHFRPATLADLGWVGSRMKDEDACGRSRWEIVKDLGSRPGRYWAAEVDGEPVAVWGGFLIAQDTYFVFLISTTSLRPHTKLLLTTANQFLKQFEGKRLVTTCNASWKKANRLLEHLGFTKTHSSNELNYYRREKTWAQL